MLAARYSGACVGGKACAAAWPSDFAFCPRRRRERFQTKAARGLTPVGFVGQTARPSSFPWARHGTERPFCLSTFHSAAVCRSPSRPTLFSCLPGLLHFYPALPDGASVRRRFVYATRAPPLNTFKVTRCFRCNCFLLEGEYCSDATYDDLSCEPL